MREIIFRGQRKDNKEWVTGNLFIDEKNEKYEILVGYTNYRIAWEVLPETVGQYTGLKDKNGKRIFEGDIIRYADIDEYRMYLESLECPEDYQENAFYNMWTIDEVVYGINVGYPAFDLNKHDWEVNGLSNLNESGGFYYEVIGNIHLNPELLE